MQRQNGLNPPEFSQASEAQRKTPLLGGPRSVTPPRVANRVRQTTPIPDVAEVIDVDKEPRPLMRPPTPSAVESSEGYVQRIAPLPLVPRRTSLVSTVASQSLAVEAPAQVWAKQLRTCARSTNGRDEAEEKRHKSNDEHDEDVNIEDADELLIDDNDAAPVLISGATNDDVVEAPKTARKRVQAKSTALRKYQVLVSCTANPTRVEKLRALGATVLNSESIAGLHVVSNAKYVACAQLPAKRKAGVDPKTTMKILAALALDAPIVSYDWIDACVEANAAVPTDEYLLPLRSLIAADAPSRNDKLPSMSGRRVELLGGSEIVRTELGVVLQLLGMKMIKGRVGDYKLSVAIDIDGSRGAEKMRERGFTVVGMMWLKHCLCARGFVEPSSLPERYMSHQTRVTQYGDADDDDNDETADNEGDGVMQQSKRNLSDSFSVDGNAVQPAALAVRKRKRVIASLSDDEVLPAAAQPIVDEIDDNETVALQDDDDDEIESGSEVAAKAMSHSRSLIVPSPSPRASPPAPVAHDNAEQSVAFDEIPPATQYVTETQRSRSKAVTPVSSPASVIPRALEPAPDSVPVQSSDDGEQRLEVSVSFSPITLENVFKNEKHVSTQFAKLNARFELDEERRQMEESRMLQATPFD